MAREIFKNLPDTSTPINAQKLNSIFNGEEAMGSITVEDIKSKNLFNKYCDTYKYNSDYSIADDYIRVTTNLTTSSANTYVRFFLDVDKLLGKTLTLSLNWKSSSQVLGNARILYLNETNGVVNSALIKSDSSLEESFAGTFTVPKTLPDGAVNIVLVLYSNNGGTSNAGDYVDYYDVMIEEGNTKTEYTPQKYFGYTIGNNANGDYIRFENGICIYKNASGQLEIGNLE